MCNRNRNPSQAMCATWNTHRVYEQDEQDEQDEHDEQDEQDEQKEVNWRIRSVVHHLLYLIHILLKIKIRKNSKRWKCFKFFLIHFTTLNHFIPIAPPFRGTDFSLNILWFTSLQPGTEFNEFELVELPTPRFKILIILDQLIEFWTI